MTVSDRPRFTSKLLSLVRSQGVLWQAWKRVRKSALCSPSTETRAEAERVEVDPIRYMKRLQDQLRTGRFKFSPQKGVAKSRKGKLPRGIISSPVENRIVQRALLDVLQEGPKDLLGQLPILMQSETSVGGVPKRGVKDAVALIKGELDRGREWFIRSDVKDFFTRVRVPPLIELVERETGDAEFAAFLQQALRVDLLNAQELKRRGLLAIFPDENMGVPQGSPLSALAANLSLRDFDRVMNTGDLTCVRYIDDFVVLGRDERAVWAGWRRGKAELDRLGLEAWSPQERSDKASFGSTSSGFDFLSYHFSKNGVGIANAAAKKFRDSIRDDLRAIGKEFGEDPTAVRTNERRFVQRLKTVDERIRGWAHSFQLTERGLELIQLDEHLGREVRRLFGTVAAKSKRMKDDDRGLMRSLGVSLLHDIHLSRRELPETERD